MTLCHTPVYYFPSQVVFIDDSRDFLTNFSLQLDERINYKLHNSPHEAAKMFANPTTQTNIAEKCLSESAELIGHQQNIRLNVNPILNEMYNPQRFARTTVVVVDFAMPSMNGIEFCQQISQHPAFKILLTGRADEKTAITAFNNQLIDAYIQKSDFNLAQTMNNTLLTMQKRHFQQLSDNIVQLLTVQGSLCLSDPVFADFFTTLCDQHEFIEYYLAEPSGSFVLLDNHANVSFLIVKNQADVQHLYEMAQDSGLGADALAAIKAGRCLPLLWSDSTDADYDWQNQLYPAQRIEGQQTYFYALVRNPLLPHIPKSDILAYEQYLATLV